MWKKVRSIEPDVKSVTLPVMDVNGEALISPTFAKVKESFSAAPKLPDEITLYGSATCGPCRALRENLENAGATYVFYNVDSDASKKKEMWRKIKSSYPGIKSVKFPVVDIYGMILINPTLEEVMKYR
jgi:glutaredoxin